MVKALLFQVIAKSGIIEKVLFYACVPKPHKSWFIGCFDGVDRTLLVIMAENKP